MMRRFSAISIVASLLTASIPALAQDPTNSKAPANAEGEIKPPPPPAMRLDGIPDALPKVEVKVKGEIKPLPLIAIPDDPPPHEGAFIDIPYVIEPPDILDVEILEALPGRPITGERIVRPDGTISLGFYGDVNVRGLTIDQAKDKIIRHCRKHLDDSVLGLIEAQEVGVDVVAPPPGPEVKPVEPKLEENLPKPPATRPSATGWSRRRSARTRSAQARIRRIAQQQLVDPERMRVKGGKPAAQPEEVPPQVILIKPAPPVNHPEMEEVDIDPVNSNRVYVDVVAYNSKVYYVQGDVGVPGRLPFTGHETVLDALNYAGGFVPTAEPTDIHLYRPARGGKPAKDYKIDHAAILRGVAEANLQIFPNDRLVVGRNPIVKQTVEFDRAAAGINSLLNSIMQYSYTARALVSMNTPYTSNVAGPASGPSSSTLTPAERDARMKEWFEFFQSISDKDKGAMLNEKAFKEALMKKLTPTPDPKKE